MAAAAVRAAAELMDTAEKPQSVLRIVIDNMIYPITLEVIHKVKYLDVVSCIQFLLLYLFVDKKNKLCSTTFTPGQPM